MADDIHDWCNKNFNLTLEDIIGNLGDESSLLEGIDDAPMGPADDGRSGGGAADPPADWLAVPGVKREEASLPSPPPRPPAVPTPQQKPAARPVQPVRPLPAAAIVSQTPVVIDGKTYVISGQMPAGATAATVASTPAQIIKTEQPQTTLAVSGSPVIYTTVPSQMLNGAPVAVPTLVTAGFPLLVDADRLPISKLPPSTPAGGGRPRPASVSPSASTAGDEPPRKNSHNAIEKRYRTSINDKIQDMRVLVCGPDSDSKMTKSAILKKAIDYIRFLKHQNQRFRDELRVLRKPIDPSSARLEDLLRPSVYSSPPHTDSGPSSPDEASGGPSSSEPTGSPSSSSPSPGSVLSPPAVSTEYNERVAFEFGLPSPPGLSDRTRMTLCMFLLAFLAFNPVRQVTEWGRDSLAPASMAAPVAGRTMLSAESEPSSWWTMLFSPVTVWLTNVVIFLILLLNIFIYGEPKVALHCDAARAFWKMKEQGETDHRNGRIAEARDHLERSLRHISKPVPSSALQWAVAFVWQVFRQASHHIPGGLWLARRGHRVLMSRREREDLYMMSAGYARVYHRLHQLSLSGHGPDGRVPGLTLSLAALNYAEVAGGALSPSCRAETFACAALQLKQSLPDMCGWLARLILQKGLAGLETVPVSLRWLATSDGMRFFMEHKWTYEKERSSMFASSPPASPLFYVRQLFHEHLLERTVQTLTMPGARCVDVCDKDLLRRSHVADALRYCQLVSDTTETRAADDAAVRWWAGVAELIAVWWLGQDERAAELYGRVEALPAPLHDTEDPLPRAVRVALQAWRCQSRGGGPAQVLPACRVSAALLEESITLSGCTGVTSVATQHIQLLVCDLLLQTRTGVWEQSRRVPPAGRQLAEFQQVLTCLRAVSVRLPCALSRVFLHEATVRMMAGAAPARTQQLLERSLRNRSGRSYSVICGSEKQPHQYVGEREHAIALMMACKHLPEDLISCPGERAGMLTEAAATLEKIGDKRRLKDCFTMMKSIGASFPSERAL
ncbi:Sterol regulatory element-binding protein 1 [Amphibalanus amphitrite]|uniref:Sterol regulatory element-binding protein 1 n=1 Tax=Amphibalanus amphitrite TaxID=1232801 RepID=A0A6A4W015_AMPAM|nr:Sterol regulatory element-binding protein 1 [Amphibalanus amphitrite]